MPFQSAEVILDAYGRPVFVLPEELPPGECQIHVHDESLDFTVNGQKIGHLGDVTPELLVLVHLQPKIGLIVYADTTKPCPSTLTHVATVTSHLVA